MNFTYSDYLGLTLVFYFPIYMKQWPKPLEGSGIFSTHLVLLSLLIIKNLVQNPTKKMDERKQVILTSKTPHLASPTSPPLPRHRRHRYLTPSPSTFGAHEFTFSTWGRVFQYVNWASKLLTLVNESILLLLFLIGQFCPFTQIWNAP